MSLFKGLSAFPLTPLDQNHAVDIALLGDLLEKLVDAGVDSIGLLGSTGIYAYLDHHERARAVAAAVEVVNHRVPLIVGVGSLRTDWSVQLARGAEKAGADGVLLAPVSYAKLTSDEVEDHFRTVASTTALPLCIYNNPGTTQFTFPEALIARLSDHPNIAAVKMPLPANDDFAGELDRLRKACNPDFSVGYSGDWGSAAGLLAGADAWYSVVAGVLPELALRLTRAAQTGEAEDVAAMNRDFEPLWALFKTHGSLRVMYAVASHMGLAVGVPPLPIKRLSVDVERNVANIVDGLRLEFAQA